MYAAVLTAAIPLTVGIALVRRPGRRLTGWLLVAHAVSVMLVLGVEAFDWPAGVAAHAGWFDGVWLLLFWWQALLAYLTPTAHPVSRRLRVWLITGATGALVFVAAAGASGRDDGGAGWAATAGVVGAAALAVELAFLFGASPAVWLRLRRARGSQRTGLLWLAWGALSLPTALLMFWVNLWLLGDLAWVTQLIMVCATAGVPLAIGAGLWGSASVDVPRLLSSSVTWLALTAGVLTLYGGALWVTGRLFGRATLGGAVAVAVVAVAVHPAASALRGRVDRWVYGYRAAPAEALRLLARRAEDADAASLSDSVTGAIREGLGAERVWIEPPGATGEATLGALRVPLEHRGERLGDLMLVCPPGRRLSPDDLRLVDDLARHAATLVRAELLNARLSDSRTRLVASREEERRRLRRDLHDGLGPSLAGMVLQLGAIRARSDPAEREALIDALRRDVRDAIAEVRRVIDDLRPPALDELGLVEAIRQGAGSLSAAMSVDVAAPGQLPQLPAATEVAAYRIAMEALTNAARHSDAGSCRVLVEVWGGGGAPALRVEVADDGMGAASPPGDGVGWASMSERARELGGSCTRAASPGGGLVVTALLPLPAEAAHAWGGVA